MQKVFEYFDSEKKGYITIEDVERVMQKLQHMRNEIEFPSKENLNESFEKYSKKRK